MSGGKGSFVVPHVTDKTTLKFSVEVNFELFAQLYLEVYSYCMYRGTAKIIHHC